MSKEIVDIYAPIKKLLPIEAKLGFVFDIMDPNTPRKLIFYTEGKGRRVRQASYDGKSLKFENQTNNPMLDDGLHKEETLDSRFEGSILDKKKEVSGAENLFNHQFRAASKFDLVLIEMLHNDQLVASSATKVAIGLDLVFTRIGEGVVNCVYDRRDWEFGDSLLAMLRDYPVLNRNVMNKGAKTKEDLRMNEKNAEYIFEELHQAFSQAHRSDHAMNVVTSIWGSIYKQFAICEFHPVLGPLYEKVVQSSRSYLVDQL